MNTPEPTAADRNEPQPAQQVEPREDVFSFAASANELATRIRDGHGLDLNNLVGAVLRDRAA